MIEFRDGELTFEYRGNVVSTPDASDIAQGFQRYLYWPDELQAWASVVLAATGLLDLSGIESTAAGNVLLEGLWDASASGEIDPKTAEVVSRLAL